MVHNSSDVSVTCNTFLLNVISSLVKITFKGPKFLYDLQQENEDFQSEIIHFLSDQVFSSAIGTLNEQLGLTLEELVLISHENTIYIKYI